MKKISLLTFFICFFIIAFNIKIESQHQIFTAINPISIDRENIVLEICVDSLKNIQISKNTVVSSGETTCISEIIKSYKENSDYLLVYTSLKAKEIKKFFINENIENSELKLTSAHIGEKVDYIKKDRIFTEGKFISVQRTKIPNDHTPQDAYYQYEGTGWESDKVAYRIYLDERNKIDIFGKVKPEPVMDKVGEYDLLPGNESYQKMQDWGMDIFKVANTMGMGSFCFYKDKIIPISKPDSVVCEIVNNGNLYSNIKVNYYGTELENKKIDFHSKLSIKAGSRLTKNKISLSDESEKICAGLAKHSDTEFIKSDISAGEWEYIGIYGKQSLAGDNLGTALVYKKSQLVEQKEDELNQLIILKPGKGSVSYYFAAAWEKEKDGIKNISEFKKYLEDTIVELNNPVIIDYK